MNTARCMNLFIISIFSQKLTVTVKVLNATQIDQETNIQVPVFIILSSLSVCPSACLFKNNLVFSLISSILQADYNIHSILQDKCFKYYLNIISNYVLTRLQQAMQTSSGQHNLSLESYSS